MHDMTEFVVGWGEVEFGGCAEEFREDFATLEEELDATPSGEQ